jgi:hypothetical protein
MGLALLLLYGVVPAVMGYLVVSRFAAERTVLVVCGAILLLSGSIMLGSALWSIVSLGHQRLPLWTGSVASILSGGVLAGVTLTDVLPCSGPG